MTLEPPTINEEVVLTPASQLYGTVDADQIRRIFRNQAKMLSDNLSKNIDVLQRGNIRQRAFVRQSMRALQRAYYAVFSLGALSVDPFHVITIRDIEVINAELLGERRFLQSFARDLSRGLLDLAPELRARLYLKALRGVFELGRVSSLPSGPYDWILGDTDHCVPCIAASLNGPYKRDEFSRMSLPVLPGIPGSGEVCQGLTSCGCITRLRNFPVNEPLQLDLREILVEVG